jgi:hypothetical protein
MALLSLQTTVTQTTEGKRGNVKQEKRSLPRTSHFFFYRKFTGSYFLTAPLGAALGFVLGGIEQGDEMRREMIVKRQRKKEGGGCTVNFNDELLRHQLAKNKKRGEKYQEERERERD